jgi:hypothetical protein
MVDHHVAELHITADGEHVVLLDGAEVYRRGDWRPLNAALALVRHGLELDKVWLFLDAVQEAPMEVGCRYPSVWN